MELNGHMNPFRPGMGAIPPTLAGRQDVINAFTAQLDRLVAREAFPHIMLLTGPRGGGKTSLLVWLAREGTSRNVSVIDLDVKATTGPEKLGSAISQSLPYGTAGTAAVEIGLQAPASMGGGSIRWERYPEQADCSTAGLLRSLSAARPTILVVDEIHEMDPEAAGHCPVHSRSQPERIPFFWC